MKPYLVYKSLVTLVVTFTRSDAGEIRDGVVIAMWEGILGTQGREGVFCRAAREAIVRVAGKGVVRTTGKGVSAAMKGEEEKDRLVFQHHHVY